MFKIINNQKKILLFGKYYNNKRFCSTFSNKDNDVILLGTDKSELIIEDDCKDSNDLYNHLKESVNYIMNHQNPYLLHHISLEKDEALSENLSMANYYSSYYPKRTIKQEIPYYSFDSLFPNELYESNPFLLLLPHPKQKLKYPWNLYINNEDGKKLPLNINKQEFQNELEEKIKKIYNIAKLTDKSNELEELSCQPSTLNLLLLRDTYWTIEKNKDKFNFNYNDLVIENFNIIPINSKSLPFNQNTDRVLKIESTFSITLKKQIKTTTTNEIPIIIKTIWVTPINKFNWKLLDITYETPTIK